MIVGITGTKAAGRGVISEILKKKGFHYESLSDAVREEAFKKGLRNYTTKDLQDVGDNLRKEKGLGILVNIVLDKVSDIENIVIDGIRNTGEIDELKKIGNNFYLISVDAPSELRYGRWISRNRVGDPKNWSDILKLDKRDLGFGVGELSKESQQVGSCMALADYSFINDYSDVREAEREFIDGKEGFLNLFNPKKRRFSFKEGFMRDAYQWGMRSTCMRRNVGAVISKDDRFVSQGYNGAVRDSRHCEELGCKRAELKIPSGMRLEICRGTHAEENAIINAGRDGVNVIGATLYCTNYPCSLCAKTVVQSGISKVIYEGDYGNDLAKETFEEVGIEAEKFSGVTPRAFPKIWG